MTAAAPPFLAHRPPRSSLEMGSRVGICFFHPGYDASNLLLTLPRVDGNPPNYGVHHRTALLACQIIAGNAFNNSRFALDRAGQQPVHVLLDGVLTDTEYFFIVDIDGSDPYPIVPSFQDWQFPHNHIPDFWPQPTSSTTVTCGVTNANYAIDGAHLVPQKERAWYDDNMMSRYGVDLPDIDNQANILSLRKDIHHCFDDRWLVISPKIAKVENRIEAPSIQYVTHIISPSAAGLWPTYHNTLVESLHSGSRAYIFARFAWAILLRVKLFIIANCPRHVIQAYKDIKGEIKYKAEHCDGKILITKYGGGGSQAATSKKRKSAQDTNDEENSPESSCTDSVGTGLEEEARWYLMEEWNERGTRGRGERQESSGETAPDVGETDAKAHPTSDVEADLREALHEGISEQ